MYELLVDLLVETGLQVHVAQLPDGVDPDEYLCAHGQRGFERLVSDAVTIFDFLVETAHRRYALQSRSRNTEDTVAAAQFILPTIAKVPNAMLRSEYVRMLAERLHLDEEALGFSALELVKRLQDSSPGIHANPSRVSEWVVLFGPMCLKESEAEIVGKRVRELLKG